MKDATGREINYLRISVTDRCNLRCVYCMPESGVPELDHSQILSLEELSHLAGVINAEVGIRKIRITGGEPLVRKGVVSLVRQLSGLAETVMTTNGILLSQFAEFLSDAGLKRVNISLDSLNDNVLKMVTRRDVSLSLIEKAIQDAKSFGLIPVKVNCVVLKGINTDELGDMVRWACDMGVQIRFIEHMPMEGSAGSYYPGSQIVADLENELGEIRSLGLHGTANMYSAPGGLGFGLIAPVCSDMCSSCNRLRLTAEGLLLPCLAGGEPLDLRSLLRNGAGEDEIRRRIRALACSKPIRGRCGGVRMWRIGG